MYDSVKRKKDQLSKDIFPTEAWDLILHRREKNDLIIMDVSSPKEYKDLHLEGAINVHLLSKSFKSRIDVMDRNKIFVVYCTVGGRSKIAQNMMLKFGFHTVYNIKGGTLLWEEEGLPFESRTNRVKKSSLLQFFISIISSNKIKRLFQNLMSRIT